MTELCSILKIYPQYDSSSSFLHPVSKSTANP